MKLIEAEHPLFRRLWVRIAVVAVCLGWGLFEFWTGEALWGTLFTGAGIYAAWALLIAFDPQAGERKEKDDG